MSRSKRSPPKLTSLSMLDENPKRRRPIVGIRRVVMSAFRLTKFDVERSKGDIYGEQPILSRLGPALSAACVMASAVQRARSQQAAKGFWRKELRRASKCGLPMHWPQEHGGLGIQGKYQADVEYRKAVANWAAVAQEDRPDLRSLLLGDGRTELSTASRRITKALLNKVKRVPVKRRGKGGTVREIEGYLTPPKHDSMFAGFIDSVEADPTPPLVVDDTPSSVSIEVVKLTTDSDEPRRPYNTDRKEVWVGMPVQLIREEIAITLETRLRSATIGDGDPRSSRSSFQSRVKRVAGVIRELHKRRPGVNPVALTKVDALLSYRGNTALLERASLEDVLEREEMGHLIGTVLFKHRKSPPKEALLEAKSPQAEYAKLDAANREALARRLGWNTVSGVATMRPEENSSGSSKGVM